MYKEEKAAGEAVTVCITCASWASNYMTVFDFGRCAHMPAWVSTSHNSHCERHNPAQNIARRVQWLANKRGVVGTTAQAWGVK